MLLQPQLAGVQPTEGDKLMKAILVAGAAIIVISVGSYFILNEIGFSAKDTYASENVRLD
jgi:hypothetical protein